MKLSAIFVLLINCFIHYNGRSNSFLYGCAKDEESNSSDLFTDDIDRSIGDFGSAKMFNYFNNLTNNFGNNNEPVYSCGYVALGMLMNYFDTIYDDAVVEEKYEVNTSFDSIHFDANSCESPGTLYEQSSGINNITVSQYISYLRNNYEDSSLHAKLILLFYDYRNDLPSNPTFMEAFGTNPSNLSTITDLYYSNDNYVNTLSYSTSSSSLIKFPTSQEKEVFFDAIDSYLNMDIPVILGFGGHFNVVFAKRNGQYYYHRGILGSNRIFHKNANSIMTELTLNENLVSFVLTFSNISNFGSYHYHSTHFNDNNTYNGSYINHYYHVYDYYYIDFTLNKHRSYCKCNLFVEEQHLYLINLHYNEEYCLCGRRNPFYV